MSEIDNNENNQIPPDVKPASEISASQGEETGNIESGNTEQNDSTAPLTVENTDKTDAGAHKTDSESKASQINSKAEFFEWFEMVVFACCFVLVIFTFLVRPARVIGASMEDTLFEGDTLFISDLYYTPDYGDIIVFQDVESSKTDPVVKRVIATEGQWVKIKLDIQNRTMTVWVSNTSDFTGIAPLDESSYVKLVWDEVVFNPEQPFQVPKGHIFVMGDNRNHSLDSRSSTFSFIDKDKILGKVLLRIYPLSRFGVVK